MKVIDSQAKYHVDLFSICWFTEICTSLIPSITKLCDFCYRITADFLIAYNIFRRLIDFDRLS